MSGHSKFSNIKHKKAAQDSIRAKAFVKLNKAITIAVQKAGPDPATNPSLRLCISKARAQNMPKSNYLKAIERASNPHNNANFEEFMYEGYAKGGVAVMVECLSDNRNRTGANIKSAFNRAGASLGGSNSVAYSFQRNGVIHFVKPDLDEDALVELLLDDDLINFTYDPDSNEGKIYVNPKNLASVQEKIIAFGIEDIIESENRFVANDAVVLDTNNLAKFQKLIQTLENDDDVNNVYHNCSNLET